jgi:hypothetical protein
MFDAKLTVSPGKAVAIAWRSVQLDPGQIPPPSALLFTVIVAPGVSAELESQMAAASATGNKMVFM